MEEIIVKPLPCLLHDYFLQVLTFLVEMNIVKKNCVLYKEIKIASI